MRTGVWTWMAAVLLGLALAARGDSWVVDGDARGAVKEKSTIWSLGREAQVEDVIGGNSNAIPTSGAVVEYVAGVTAPLRADVATLGGRMTRTEIDLLNNYLFDATESAVGTYPLAWGFADTFSTTNAVFGQNVQYSAAGELYSVRLPTSEGPTNAALRLHYRMNDNSGNATVADTIAGGAGTFHSTGSSHTDDHAGTGVVGGALGFTAANTEWVQSGKTFDWSAYAAGGMTLACWFKRTEPWGYDYTQHVLVCAGGGNNGFPAMWLMVYEGGVDGVRWLFAGYYAQGWYYDECGIPDDGVYVPPVGEWMHIASTYDATNAVWTYFVNGVAAATKDPAAWPSPVSSTPQPLYVGAFSTSDGVLCNRADKMLVDDVRLYDRALTADEVAELYAGGGGTEGDDAPGHGPPIPGAVAVLESVPRHYAEVATEGYLSVQLEVADAAAGTNVHGFISADMGATWGEVSLQDRGSLGAGVRLFDGAGTYPAPGTGMAVRIVATNGVQGLNVHGWAYGRR